MQARVEHAHGILSALIERRHAKPVALSLIQAAQHLRAALELLDSDKASRRLASRKLMSRTQPLDLRSFARLVARDQDQTFRVRLAALEALGYTGCSTPFEIQEFADLAALIAAFEEAQKLNLADAAAKAHAEPEWSHYSARRICAAIRIHRIAMHVLRGRK